jgi:drug/metabolite transporter (DMT)-like permease
VLTGNKIAGMILVLIGLLFVNFGKKSGTEKTKPVYIVLVLVSCIGNAVSELLDKMLMQHMNSGQLQFWYMFFLVILYLGYLLVTRTKIQWKTLCKNYWILILSVLFVIGDKALFVACSRQDSTVVAMTLIKQCSVLITIIGGRLVFKEKRTAYKLVCAAVIIAGIVLAVV